MTSNIVPFSAEEPPQHEPFNPLMFIHRLLRGRYVLATSLASIIGIPCALIAYTNVRPMYTSQAVVRIHSSRPILLDLNEINEPLKNLDAEVQTQAEMLRSERVRIMANKEYLAKTVQWPNRHPGWPVGLEGLKALDRAIRITPQRRGDLIFIRSTHTDPRSAKEAANATLDAYMYIQETESGSLFNNQESELDDLIVKLEDDLGTFIQAREEIESNVESSNLESTIAQLEDQRSRVESMILSETLRLEKLKGEVMDAGDGSESEPSVDPADGVVAVPDPEELAMVDEILAGMLARRSFLQTELAILSKRLGETHPQIKKIVNEIDGVDQSITARAVIVASQLSSGESTVVLPGSVEATERNLNSALAMKAILNTQLQPKLNLRKDLRDATANIELISLQLDRARIRLNSLQLERKPYEGNMSRARRFQEGELPRTPSTDRRRVMSVGAFLGGAGIGVGFVALLGLRTLGVRYIDEIDARTTQAPLLGCLPDLDDGDDSVNEMAALSVHHIRNALEIGNRDRSGPTVILLTSPASGDGKTSLSLSLASSFAIAGHRTLIVDADIVGRGLSGELGLSDVPGLAEALNATHLNGEIHATATPGLSAIPAGSGQRLAPEHMSASQIESFINAIGQSHDVIVIDTGPVLGSLEANLFASVSNELIMVVGRGCRQRVLDAALARLKQLGVPCTGIVFNRATNNDFSRSVSTASLGHASVVSGSRRLQKSSDAGLPRL